MKKIMFNDQYGLTAAVLEGRKTMTRRVITGCKSDTLPYGGVDGTKYFVVSTNDGVFKSTYKVSEVVAVAQNYQDAIDNFNGDNNIAGWGKLIANTQNGRVGYYNKMFTRADLMPHHIRITDIKVERLQDISETECLKEGIMFYNCGIDFGYKVYSVRGTFKTPQEAFAVLIDRVSGKGTWDSNPWVFAYSFDLIK